MILDFKKDYILENEVVRLEPLREQHLPSLKVLAGDTEIWTFFDEGGIGKIEFKQYIFSALDQRLKEQQYPFVVFDKRGQQFGGMTRLYAYDSVLRNIKLGHTWIGTDFQGTGLNKACKHCILKFAFEDLLIERVGFGVHEENVKSIGAMKSFGIIEEGRLRNFLNSTQNKGRSDLILFGITKDDWNNELNESLFKKYQTKHSN